MGTDPQPSATDAFTPGNVVLTPELFAELAVALHVRWPEWFRRLVLALLNPPLDGYRIHLDGGLTFALPQLIYEETRSYRTGQRELRDWSASGHGQAVPWPISYVVVGHCGVGDIVIDTGAETGDFLCIDKENSSVRLLLNVSALGPSPEDAARILKSEASQTRAARNAERHRARTNPFLRT